MDVKFLQGTQEDYEALGTYESGTFYFTGTNLYLGTICLSSTAELTEALYQIQQNSEAIEELKNSLGDLEDLQTTSKTDLVSAINEIVKNISDAYSDLTVVVDESSSDDYAKVYTLTQNRTVIGTINIPKDLVVQSGKVEVNPDGQPEGTYIVLTLANSDDTKIYVNVEDLIDIYTAQQNAVQIQLAVNGTEISATVVAGSITATELADAAVTTDKIADGNVTTDKLSTVLQAAIESAQSAVQSVTTGVTNGTISVDGTEVSVAGLGSAAYASSTEFDAAGSASAALTEAKEYADSLLVWTEY